MSAAPAKAPCKSCPYRKDVPSGVWAAEEYDKLPPYDNDTPHQPLGAFYCHQQDGRLCAGWVGCHDMANSLGLRMAALRLSDAEVKAALDYRSPVELFESGRAAAEHGRRDIENPDLPARRTVDRLTRKRERRREQ